MAKIFNRHSDDSESQVVIVACFRAKSNPTAAFDRLNKNRIHSSAYLHARSDSLERIGNHHAGRAGGALLGAVLLAATAILILALTREESLAAPDAYESLLRVVDIYRPVLMACGVLGAILGYWGSSLIYGVPSRLLKLFRPWISPGETLLVVRSHVRDAQRILGLLRDNPDDLPGVFVFHGTSLPFRRLIEITEAPHDESNERLSAYARALAESQTLGQHALSGRVLRRRLQESEASFMRVCANLASSARNEQRVEMSAEWLLDNAYMVRDHIAEYQDNLPGRFYRELPVLQGGDNDGLPRVYEIAKVFVRETQAQVTVDDLLAFLHAFQVVAPLTMGELWALPLMLRLVLVEYLAEIVRHVERRQSERELGDFWASRLLSAARTDAAGIDRFISLISRTVPNPSAYLAQELIGNLADTPEAVAPLRAWLDQALGMPAPEAITRERSRQAVQQLSLVNTLSSLRLLAQTSWTEVFDRASIVDLVLRTDPAGIYHDMDYRSRDYYRKAVEALGRGSKTPELDIANVAIRLSENAQNPLERHVGYYLIGDGRIRLEHEVHSRPRARLRIRRALSAHPALTYVGAVMILTVCILALAIHTALMPLTAGLVILSALAMFPASEVAVQLVNDLLARLFEPSVLPKMDFAVGVPPQFKTLVVVPMMLLTPESIQQEVERLQIRALANPDNNLLFALLSDFSDADRQTMPEDDERLEIVRLGIQRLGERFFLFHRNREWSESEQRWMGWERKRGKLDDLNNYLTGNRREPRVADLLIVGDEQALIGVRFVITLDADTQLPRGTAKQLVATISHPLNQPRLASDGRSVKSGYTIIQPRVTTSLPSATETLFSRLFTDSTGIDPYARAVSDPYQDLSGEGIYHGKGIYDVATFHTVLSGRFPEQHLLSHDLIEGAHATAGLATDIELHDTFPADSYAYLRREHRWIRGDWQIADWIFPRVPANDGQRVRNPLSPLNRWKLFDNLRRSLASPAIVALLIAAWFLTPGREAWIILAVAPLLLPVLLQLITDIMSDRRYRIFKSDGPWIGFARVLVWAALLPAQAAVALDAISRALFRRTISHRLLLEWETAQQIMNYAKEQALRPAWGLLWVPIASAFVTGFLVKRHAHIPIDALIFLILWIASPFISLWIAAPRSQASTRELSGADRRTLRLIACRTWRFFDHFVGPETNWLPPDNFQEDLNVEVAMRTSPTNIGMWLLSTIAAADLGYITIGDAVGRVRETFNTIDRLEKHEGHLLNWFTIDACQPLHPRYVSMVDSGNLLGALWALDQSYSQFLETPISRATVIEGIADAVALIKDCSVPPPVLGRSGGALKAIQNECESPPADSPAFISQLRALRRLTTILRNIVQSESAKGSEVEVLCSRLTKQVEAWNEFADIYFGWVDVISNLPANGLLTLGSAAHEWRRQALASNPSLRSIAQGQIPAVVSLLSLRSQRNIDDAARRWLDSLAAASERATAAARDLIGQIGEIQRRCRTLADGMNMRFLYVPAHHLFAVGYNVDEGRIDNFYYNLLASEARLGSFVSIARGEIPLEHWFSLGRPMGHAYGQNVLLSWSGTMFEYMMPLLLTRSFENSLLDYACRAAVSAQIAYGNTLSVPWGISESGYSAVDARQVYQYHAFGVPGLGLQRRIEEDLVVAPYATALALAVSPKQAVQNIKHLEATGRPRRRGMESLVGPFGFYESIDYSRERDRAGSRGVVTRSYMSHHQGMTLIAIDNALNDNIMQARFHADLRVRSTESLLYERIPTVIPKLLPETTTPANLNIVEPAPFSTDAHFDTPNTTVPRTHLLSNSEFSTMLTNSGGGYSRWRNFEIVRWRSDTTCDSYGSFVYLKDVESGDVWSNTFHPLDENPEDYRGTFNTEKADFRSRRDGIEMITEVVVSPEDNAEVRRLTIVNHTQSTRTIEVTSYVELALAPHANDRTHPAFSKLFVQTEAAPEIGALLAHRRPQAKDDPTPWAAHVAVSSNQPPFVFMFETDREKFIGRGRTLRRPAAIDREMSSSTGAVLDPVFSIRKRVVVRPGERSRIAFITIAGDSREAVYRQAAKYAQMSASDRAIDLAWTDAQLILRQLRIQPDEAMRYQVLSSAIFYADSRFRPPDETLRAVKSPRSHLWAYGISGDLPIVVILVRGTSETELVRQAVRVHAYWRVRGLVTDLVIIDQEASTYGSPLRNLLQQVIDSHTVLIEQEKPGGVFLRSESQLAPDDMTLLVSLAHVVLVATRGSLAQQLSIAAPEIQRLPRAPRKSGADWPSAPLPFMDLKFFNGIGGFTADGREYAIYMGDEMATPAPWINVLANPNFGAIVSETGSGFCWMGNSQQNRITPWSNDPILDPTSDAIYIQDDELSAMWTPTASPIREHDAYRARHGQGYTIFEHNSHGIEQELTVFVPVADQGGDPVRVQILKLRNESDYRRHVTVTTYAQWVLGTTPEEMRMQIQTEWDASCGALLAKNPSSNDFSGKVAFLSASTSPASYTGDRSEFIGRNGSLAEPDALRRIRLSNRTGASLDPCGAIQSHIEIEPAQEIEVVFVLGEADSAAEAREMVNRYCDLACARAAFDATVGWWDRRLETVLVDIPDQSAGFLINRWLLYQVLSCRVWARSAFYQSGGAFGFRDQLQDVMALVYSAPEVAREQILTAAARQFVEGDVQHWWHPPSGAGVRTRISDDLLWLPFVAAQYCRVTGDYAILDEVVPFIEGHVLADGEHESYFVPQVSQTRGTILDHCRRAVTKGFTHGPNGLPLIGTGDWNDGLSRVGVGGRGESVWLAWFIVHVLGDMAEMVKHAGDDCAAQAFRSQASALTKSVEGFAWDGEWYLRAVYDDGTPLGSKKSDEMRIDSLPQSWAIISEAARPDRAAIAMKAVLAQLVREDHGLLLLFTPPFDKTTHDPGYIKGYVPGVRENGGQYTHGSLWTPLALARSGLGHEAVRLLNLMSPITHGASEANLPRYRIEPYVVAADIYALDHQEGRGGWTWYTGSAAWMYRVWLEEVLGFKKRGETLEIVPQLPAEWRRFRLTYRHKTAVYEITVVSNYGLGKPSTSMRLDGIRFDGSKFDLVDDGKTHSVRIDCYREPRSTEDRPKLVMVG